MLYWDQNLSSQTDFLFYVDPCKLLHLKLQFHLCNFLMHFRLFVVLCIQNTMNRNKYRRAGCRFRGFKWVISTKRPYFYGAFENQHWLDFHRFFPDHSNRLILKMVEKNLRPHIGRPLSRYFDEDMNFILVLR